MSNPNIVYKGFFIDHSQERVCKKYLLTLPDSYGGYLNNILAFYMTAIVATASWSIVSFSLHQLGDHAKPRDGQRRLTEIALRNVSNAFVFLLTVPIIWKIRSSVSIWSTLFDFLVLLTALIHWVAWIAASIFISRIELNNKFLASSPDCGYREPIPGDIGAFRTFYANQARTARNSVASCWSNQHAPSCSKSSGGHVHVTQTHNVACPFDTDLCLVGYTSAFRLHTDPISSFELGLNLPDGAYTVKRQMTCAAIRTRNQTTAPHVTIQDQSNVSYFLGPVENVTNLEHESPTLVYKTARSKADANYYIEAFQYRPFDDKNEWMPISGLRNNISDTTLYALSTNGITYPGIQQDTWFHADVPADNTTGPYTSSQYVSFVACHEEVQYCNTRNGVCSPMQSSSAPVTTNATLAWTENQIAGVEAYQFASSSFFPLQRSVNSLGTNSLLANDLLCQGRSTDLSPEQWKLELTYWFRTSLAGSSIALLDWATGAHKNLPGVQLALNPQTDKICQKHWVFLHSVTGYKTFSVAAIAIIVLVGLALIILSQVLVPLMMKYGFSNPHKRRSRVAWQNDHVFQLFRLANEGAEVNFRKGFTDLVPVPLDGELMAVNGLRNGRTRLIPAAQAAIANDMPGGNVFRMNTFNRSP